MGGFSRGLSSRHDGRARDNRIGRSGFPAGRVNIDGMERRRDTSAILWIVVGSSKDEVLAAGNAPAAALVAIKARATILPKLDLVGPSYPRDPVFENIRTSTLFGARACF